MSAYPDDWMLIDSLAEAGAGDELDVDSAALHLSMTMSCPAPDLTACLKRITSLTRAQGVRDLSETDQPDSVIRGLTSD